MLAVYTHNDLRMYRVTFSDGLSIGCCEDHQWLLTTGQVVSTKWLLDSDSDHGGPRITEGTYAVPLTKPIAFDSTPLLCDPYEVGREIASWPVSQQRVPARYRYSSIADRQQLLKGILEDHCTITGETLVYKTYSWQMCKDVRELVESLGGICSKKEKIQSRSGYTLAYYELTLCLPSQFPLVGQDVRRQNGESERQMCRRFVSIRPISSTRGKCLTVDGPSHTYLIDGCCVTHNTL